MSTLHKVKAYFGMAPMDDYDDEYYDDDDRSSRAYPRRPREERFEDEGRGYEARGAGYDDRMERGNGNGPDYVEQSGEFRSFRNKRNDWMIDRQVSEFPTAAVEPVQRQSHLRVGQHGVAPTENCLRSAGFEQRFEEREA